MQRENYNQRERHHQEYMQGVQTGQEQATSGGRKPRSTPPHLRVG